MIFITGDLHGSYDIHKLSSKNFKQQKELTRSDYVIICGDFGLLWDNSKEEKYWLKWLDQKSWTTLWIDGNHENFDMLKKYPVEIWHGGEVQKITDNIIHLCRGNIFDIEGLKFFAFGGAESHDKEYRELGVSMWKEELPSNKEIEKGRQVLADAGNKVDIILTHSFPDYIQADVFGAFHNYKYNRLTEFFEEIDKTVDFKYWFSGHYHITKQYDSKHIFVYNTLIELEHY